MRWMQGRLANQNNPTCLSLAKHEKISPSLSKFLSGLAL